LRVILRPANRRTKWKLIEEGFIEERHDEDADSRSNDYGLYARRAGVRQGYCPYRPGAKYPGLLFLGWLPMKFDEIQIVAEPWSPEEVLRWGFDRFGDTIALASSFGAEDVVLIDLAAKVRAHFPVFTLDTDFLFPETYELIDRVERKYGIQVERRKSLLTPWQQQETLGPELWKHSPDQCCEIRKVEPLKAKLAELQAWITGIRRDQTPFRRTAGKVEFDINFGLVKLNPLADWSWAQVWQYIRENQVPYNPLHNLNYPSVGCTHCTRPVSDGEDLRSGRWAGLQKTECGLHLKEQP
jgi:phosphoadenosine phosphosulfate reductase